jgi:type IV secretory pathway VirB10-like protein
MQIKKTLLLLAIAFSAASALAQWQWIDKDGRKVFSDRAPPPDIAEKNIIKQPSKTTKGQTVVNGEPAAQEAAAAAPANAASKPVATELEKRVEAKKKQLAEAESAKQKAEQQRTLKAKIENCANAKQARATYESGGRVSRTNASGEREFLDDAARAAEVKRAQTVIDSDCK